MASKKHSFLMKLTAITLVACILFINTACKDIFGFKDDFLTPPGEGGHYSEEELAELYYANADAFLAAATVLLENEQVLAYMKENHEEDYGIQSEYSKRFFTDEEWDAITEIFEIARPLMLMRCCKVANVAYYTFPIDSQTDTSVSLHYFPDPTDGVVDFYDKDFTVKYYPIDDNWWIEVTDYNKPLNVQRGTP